ncbi:MAG TPA: DUF2244 domain-containing protein [Sphingomonadaceae bacterium]|nr:DUF2244 domain-containing protein [Sphingomonadaceae bacterium]
MYKVLACPEGQKGPDIRKESAPRADSGAIVLHMRENRSHLSQEARAALAVMVVLFMATSILPLLKGVHLVPLFSIGAMAALVAGIEYHKSRRPASETLELDAARVRHCVSGGEAVVLPLATTRLAGEGSEAGGLRLFLRSGWRDVEIARCLSAEEKRSLAILLAERLRLARGERP